MLYVICYMFWANIKHMKACNMYYNICCIVIYTDISWRNLVFRVGMFSFHSNWAKMNILSFTTYFSSLPLYRFTNEIPHPRFRAFSLCTNVACINDVLIGELLHIHIKHPPHRPCELLFEPHWTCRLSLTDSMAIHSILFYCAKAELRFPFLVSKNSIQIRAFLDV